MLSAMFVLLGGFLIGSFLNICIRHIPNSQFIILHDSYCPSCNIRLEPWDMIPIVSYIMTKGKCRYCNASISFKYPIVEFVTGCMFLSLYFKFSHSIYFFMYSFFMAILIIIFVLDVRYMVILDELVIVLILLGISNLVIHMINPLSLHIDIKWYELIIGAFTASGFLYIVSLVGKQIYKTDVMGMGDVKLYIPIGIILGFRMVLVALFLAIALGGIISIVLLLTKKKSRKSIIPFGPYIIIGTFITILYGADLYTLWYQYIF